MTVEYDGTDLMMATPVANVGFLGGTLTSTTTMSGAAFNEAFATIASGATVNIGAAAANYLQVTGTTTITAFDTVQAGTRRTLEFAGAVTLTHNSTSLILPQGVNVLTVAGDVWGFISEGSGNWRATQWPVRAATKSSMQSGTDTAAVVTPARIKDSDGVAKAYVVFNASGTIQGNAFNVSSVVKNSTGNFTVTFSTNFADANFSAVATQNIGAAAVGSYGIVTAGQTTSTVVVQTFNSGNGTALDPATNVNVACFGRQ